jgi:hypothetical protein
MFLTTLEFIFMSKLGKGRIIDIIRRKKKLGHRLNLNHVKTTESFIYECAVKFFGGWPEAISAAGLDYSKLRKRGSSRRSRKPLAPVVLLRKRAG